MTRTFWALHGLAWLAYGVSTYLVTLPLLGAGQYGAMLTVKGIRTAIGCALSAGLYALFQRWRRTNLSLAALIVLVVGSSVALGVGWLSLYWLLTAPMRDGRLPPADWANFPRAAIDYAFVMMTWVLATLATQEWLARRDAQQRATEAELAARDAELRMLRYQLNPHFLFNALNSLRAMMPLEADAARRSVDALAGFLRYTLQASPLADLRLEQEIDAARDYLAIEQLRFGDRLRVRIDLDPRVAQVRVPGFLLQPLVENAVKHGMASGARPLEIGVEAGPAADGAVRIAVTNTLGRANRTRLPAADPFDAMGASIASMAPVGSTASVGTMGSVGAMGSIGAMASGTNGATGATSPTTAAGAVKAAATVAAGASIAGGTTEGASDADVWSMDAGQGAGVGLENVRRRVPLFFQERAQFAIERESSLVRAVITLGPERVH